MSADLRPGQLAAPPPSSGGGTPWSHLETTTLIAAYADLYLAADRGHLKAHEWAAVAAAVTPKTITQCRHKIEKLRRRYRAERARSGGSSWPYFPLLDRLERGSGDPNPSVVRLGDFCDARASGNPYPNGLKSRDFDVDSGFDIDLNGSGERGSLGYGDPRDSGNRNVVKRMDFDLEGSEERGSLGYGGRMGNYNVIKRMDFEMNGSEEYGGRVSGNYNVVKRMDFDLNGSDRRGGFGYDDPTRVLGHRNVEKRVDFELNGSEGYGGGVSGNSNGMKRGFYDDRNPRSWKRREFDVEGDYGVQVSGNSSGGKRGLFEVVRGDGRNDGRWRREVGVDEMEEEDSEDEEEEGPVMSRMAELFMGWGERFLSLESRKMKMMRELHRDWMETERKTWEMVVESQRCLVEMIGDAFSREDVKRKVKPEEDGMGTKVKLEEDEKRMKMKSEDS